MKAIKNLISTENEKNLVLRWSGAADDIHDPSVLSSFNTLARVSVFLAVAASASFGASFLIKDKELPLAAVGASLGAAALLAARQKEVLKPVADVIVAGKANREAKNMFNHRVGAVEDRHDLLNHSHDHSHNTEVDYTFNFAYNKNLTANDLASLTTRYAQLTKATETYEKTQRTLDQSIHAAQKKGITIPARYS